MFLKLFLHFGFPNKILYAVLVCPMCGMYLIYSRTYNLPYIRQLIRFVKLHILFFSSDFVLFPIFLFPNTLNSVFKILSDFSHSAGPSVTAIDLEEESLTCGWVDGFVGLYIYTRI
jgi:hypothetical protein